MRLGVAAINVELTCAKERTLFRVGDRLLHRGDAIESDPSNDRRQHREQGNTAEGDEQLPSDAGQAFHGKIEHRLFGHCKRQKIRFETVLRIRKDDLGWVGDGPFV